MASTTKIKVETIDHYHRDKDMKITLGLLPRKLNANKQFIDQNRSPFVNLNIKVEDTGAGEHYMESFLEYIRQKPGILGNRPDFATNKNLLKFIASGSYEDIEVQAVRVLGVIFMVKTTVEKDFNANFGAVFEHFLTGEEGEEAGGDGTVRKAVFAARIPNGLKKEFNVMYSGEIDAIDEDNQHLELKVCSHGTNDWFWERQSLTTYWQSVLSNVQTIVIGSRTTNAYVDEYCKTKGFPPYSLYKICKLKTNDIPLKVEEIKNDITCTKNKPEWTIEEGEERIRNFLSHVEDFFEEDGEFCLFTYDQTSSDWRMEPCSPKVIQFKGLVEKFRGVAAHESVKKVSSPAPRPQSKPCSPSDYVIIPNFQSVESSSMGTPVQTSTDTVTKAIGSETSSIPKKDSSMTLITPKLEISKAKLPPDVVKKADTSTQTTPIEDVPGLLQTQPKFKIYFNAPYDETQTNRLKIINISDKRIAFEVNTKSKKISISPNFGVLDSKEGVTLKISCEEFEFEKEGSASEKITIEWRNVLEGQDSGDGAGIDEDGLFRRKTILIEYNE